MGRFGERSEPARLRRAQLAAASVLAVLVLAGPAAAAVQAPATCQAGALSRGWCGDGGPATEARLASPGSLVALPDGGFAFADTLNDAIREVAPGGTISTLARLGGPAGCAPGQLAPAPDGRLLVAAPECGSVLAISPRGAISAIAGAGSRARRGAGSQLVAPSGVALAPDGTVLVADDGAILRVGRDGVVHPLHLVPRIRPVTLLAMPGGQLLASGGSAGVVWSVDLASGRTRVVLGRPVVRQASAGPLVTHFDPAVGMPTALTALPDGGFAFADAFGDRVRSVGPDGQLTTIAGDGKDGFGGDGGPPRAARLSDPAGVAVRGDGGVLIADAGNDRIRLVAPGAGRIRTVAGGGSVSGALVPGTPGARVHFPVLKDSFYLYRSPVTARRGRSVVVRVYTSQPARVLVVVSRGRRGVRTVRASLRIGIDGIRVGSFRAGRYNVEVAGVSGRQRVGDRAVLVVR